MWHRSISAELLRCLFELFKDLNAVRWKRAPSSVSFKVRVERAKRRTPNARRSTSGGRSSRQPISKQSDLRALHAGTCAAFVNSQPMSGHGPTLPTWAMQQVGGYLGYTGRAANVIAKAALDPNLTLPSFCPRSPEPMSLFLQSPIRSKVCPPKIDLVRRENCQRVGSAPGPLISNTVPSGQ
jgi:hypothetical protein